MPYCTSCGHLHAGGKFCPECGTPQPSVSTNMTAIPTTIRKPTPPNPQRSVRPLKGENIYIQIFGWIFFWWLLIPIAIWRSSWSQNAKIVATGCFALFLFSIPLNARFESQRLRVTPTPNNDSAGVVPARSTPRPTRTPLATATAAPPTDTPLSLTATVAKVGNLRDAPSTETGKVITQVAAGDVLTVRGKTSDETWFEVTTSQGTAGWINKVLVTVDPQVVAAVAVPTPAPTPTVRTVGAGEEIEAITFCRRTIEQQLKAPGTADFPWLPDSTRYIGTDTVEIIDHVDAENSFGALIRLNYRCHVRFDWENGKKVIDLIEEIK